MTSMSEIKKNQAQKGPSHKQALVRKLLQSSRRRLPKTLAKHGQFFKGYTSPIQGVSGSSFKVSRLDAMAGQEDTEIVRMRYETSSAFTASTGGASYLQIKGNSIYRPYPGNTDSPAGYQRLYTQYERACVLGARVEVRLWSDTGAGVQQPFRIAAVPCSSSQYSVYSAYSNVTSLRGVPHSTEALFSPGAKMPVLRASGTTAQIQFGFKEETGVEVITTGAYSATTGNDPTNLWYFLVGLQAMAGTTTLNAQLQVMIEYDVMFFRPIATAVQQLTRWGNEETKDPPRTEWHEVLEKKTQVVEPGYELVRVPVRSSHFAAEPAGPAAGRSLGSAAPHGGPQALRASS